MSSHNCNTRLNSLTSIEESTPTEESVPIQNLEEKIVDILNTEMCHCVGVSENS